MLLTLVIPRKSYEGSVSLKHSSELLEANSEERFCFWVALRFSAALKGPI